MNYKQPRTEKQLGASASEIPSDDNTKGLKKTVSPEYRIKIKICATVAGVVNSEYYKGCLHAIKFELKNIIRASDAAVPTYVFNVPQKVTGAWWSLRVKYDGRFKARLIALGWKQRCECEIMLAYIFRFDLLAIATAKIVISLVFKRCT